MKFQIFDYNAPIKSWEKILAPQLYGEKILAPQCTERKLSVFIFLRRKKIFFIL